MVYIQLLLANLCQAFYYTPSGHLSEGYLKEEWIPLTNKDALDYLPKETLYRIHSPLLGGGDSKRHCLASPGALLRHISTKPNTTSTLSTVTHMMARGMNTIVIVGDSVSEQFYAELHATLQNAFGNVYEGLKTNETFRSINKWTITSSQYAHFAAQNSGYQKLHRKHNINEAHKKKSSEWKHSFYIMMVRFFENTGQRHSDMMDKLLDGENLIDGFHLHGPALVITNIGLHYNAKVRADENIGYNFQNVDVYMKDLKTILPRYISMAKAGHVVLFRETTAQHFGPPLGGQFTFTHHYDGNNGPIKRWDTLERKMYAQSEYISSYSSRVKNLMFDAKNETSNTNIVVSSSTKADFGHDISCIPIRTESEYILQSWRNHILHEIHSKINPTNIIPIIPFYNATVSRHDSHYISFDCTHYCPHNRLFWDPIWTYIFDHFTSKI